MKTPILIPGELNSIGDKSASSFYHRWYVMSSCKHGRQQISTIQSRPVKNIRKVGKKEQNEANCVYRYERWQYSKKRATQTTFHEAMLFNPRPMNCGKALKTTSCNISLFRTIKNDGKTYNRNKMWNQKSYKTDFTITEIKMFFFSNSTNVQSSTS